MLFKLLARFQLLLNFVSRVGLRAMSTFWKCVDVTVNLPSGRKNARKLTQNKKGEKTRGFFSLSDVSSFHASLPPPSLSLPWPKSIHHTASAA